MHKNDSLPTSACIPEETSPEQLAKFGLTLAEAKAWLEQEPNFFTSRRIFTGKRTDGDLTEPIVPLYKGAIVFSER